MTSIYGGFKLLAILTSAILVIAQYYENRQKNIFKEGKIGARGIEFKEAERSSKIMEYKIKWESIQNTEPIDCRFIISVLWILIVYYALLLPFVLSVPYLIETSFWLVFFNI